ncbi:MAG: DUF4349 domain-containing protein [Lachnospiraceae bacterium]|nr:DUF4349 domain-containing protein [Lachnospiraceae bacterium]
MKKKSLLIVTGLLTFSMLTGCGSNKNSSTGSYYVDKSYSSDSVACEEAYVEYDDYDGGWASETTNDFMMDVEATEIGENAAQQSNRKLISTVRLNVETKEFDSLVASIEKKVMALGGYIESSYTYNGSSAYNNTRNAEMTIRIPSASLDVFVNEVSAASNVVSKNTSVEDVTLSYVDMESRKNSLIIERDNLLEMLDQAETIEDMIIIEDRLSDVRYELESMESQLRTYDDKIDYATIYLDVDEVRELTPVREMTAGEEISEGFMGSLEDIKDGFTRFGIWFVVNLPKILLILLFPAIAVIVIVCNVKKAKKKKKARLQAMQAQTTQQNILPNGGVETENQVAETPDMTNPTNTAE